MLPSESQKAETVGGASQTQKPSGLVMPHTLRIGIASEAWPGLASQRDDDDDGIARLRYNMRSYIGYGNNTGRSFSYASHVRHCVSLCVSAVKRVLQLDYYVCATGCRCCTCNVEYHIRIRLEMKLWKHWATVAECIASQAFGASTRGRRLHSNYALGMDILLPLRRLCDGRRRAAVRPLQVGRVFGPIAVRLSFASLNIICAFACGDTYGHNTSTLSVHQC